MPNAFKFKDIIVAAAAVLYCGFLPAAAQQQTEVAVVYSYLPGEWQSGLRDGIEATLTAFGKKVKLTDFVFDSDGWAARPAADKLKEKNRLLGQLSASKYTYVIVCDDEAADLVIPGLKSDKSKKIFFTGVNRSEKELTWLKGRPANVSGIMERFQVPETLEMLRMFDKDIKSLSILTSGTKSSLVIMEDVAARIREQSAGSPKAVTLRKTYALSTWQEWQDAIADIAANDQALWLLVPYGVAGPGGKEVPVTMIGEYLRKNLSIPTLGIISVHTKIGVLVAISVSPYDLGVAVAEQVARSLNGEEQRAIGVYPLRKSRLEINLQEAERLNVAIPEKLKGIATIVNLRDLPMQR